MNEAEIEQCLKSHPLTAGIFQGVFARDEINKVSGNGKKLFVINTDKRKEPGEHWVLCFWPTSDVLPIYFDNYGFPPLHEEFYYFLLKNDPSFKYNRVQLQDIDSSVCGHYTTYFATQLCAGHSIEEIRKKHFSTVNQKMNDMFITTLFRKEFGYPIVRYKSNRKLMCCQCLCHVRE